MSGYGRRALALVIAALVPVALIASAWVVDVARRERNRLEQSIVTHADDVVARLDAAIKGHISALQVLAASPLIDRGDLAGFRQQLERARQHQPLWRNVLLSGPDYVQVLNLNMPEAGLPVAVPESHRQVYATGRPTITPVAAGPATGYKTIGVLVPVVRDGEARYVLTAVLDVSALADLLRAALPTDWQAGVLDQNQHILVRSSDGDAATGELASTSALAAIESGRAGEIREGVSRTGERFVAMHLHSAVSGWSVHVGFPVDALSVLQTRPLQLAAGGAAIGLLLAAYLAHLLYRELQAARRQATALAEKEHLEALGRLTGGIAHDFNNLLMIIQGTAHGIQRRRDDPDRIAKYAEVLITAARRGAAITTQLLSYARRERQSPVAFHIGERAGDLRILLAQSTRGNIATSLSLASDLWPIYADPSALEVALINLATNARDAMPAGGSLSVAASNATLRSGDDADTGLEGDYVAISVTDTGSGIDPDHLDRVFEPFFTTKGPEQGTGLGLSQVYGFARQAGGALTVESSVGEGTTFTLYLPRADRVPDVAGPVAAPPGRAADGKVLLVEDNEDVARAVERMLEASGLAYETVAGAGAALDRLEAGPSVDVVLSDIVLAGGISGLELAQQVGQRHPGVPVVLMTGYSEALASGVAQGLTVLSKPFGEEELLAALASARSGGTRAS